MNPGLSPARKFAGWLCLALGFGLIVLLGLGVLDPLTLSASNTASSWSALLLGLLPSVLAALLVFGIGVWLLRAGTSKGKR